MKHPTEPTFSSLNRRTFQFATAVAASAVWSTSAKSSAFARAQSPARKLRVGQIGTGHGHANKIGVYRASPDYEVVGIAEPDKKLFEENKKKDAFQGLEWMSVDQLLATKDLDVVLIETRVNQLLDTAERCVLAGKHIHLDKPAGESYQQFERILKIANDKKLLVQMGYMFRYNPAWLFLKDLHARGWLGEIFEVQGVISKVVDNPSREKFAQYRGGMMFELGCHLMDLVVDLLGEPGKVTGFAMHSSPKSDALRDNTLAVLEYPKAIATIKSSALEVEGSARRHLTVCGTEGTVHIQPIDNPKIQLALSQPRDNYKREYQEISFPSFQRYVADAADMAKILRGEKACDFSPEHDLQIGRAHV